MNLRELTDKWAKIAADEQEGVNILVHEGVQEPYISYAKQRRDMAKQIIDDLTELHPLVPPMVARFRRDKWTPTRTAIDAMVAGDSLRFPLDEYHNARESAVRLSDAYADGRSWEVRLGEREINVRRVK